MLATGLVLMAFLNPAEAASSFCPLDLLGFEFCPGDGLGRSIAYGFQGQFMASFQMHPAGLPAILIISIRIISIFHRNWLLTKHN